MFYDSCFVNEVVDFRKLRTGKMRMKVIAVNEKRRILFSARVLQNRPLTNGELLFDNRKIFNLSSRTISGQNVSLFFWTQDLEQRWLWQCKIDEILHWVEIAKPEDVIVCADFVAEESGRPKKKHHPLFVIFAKQQIEKQLPELGLVQLQRLAGMLCTDPERIAA
jgi:hypothetical protein